MRENRHSHTDCTYIISHKFSRGKLSDTCQNYPYTSFFDPENPLVEICTKIHEYKIIHASSFIIAKHWKQRNDSNKAITFMKAHPPGGILCNCKKKKKKDNPYYELRWSAFWDLLLLENMNKFFYSILHKWKMGHKKIHMQFLI